MSDERYLLGIRLIMERIITDREAMIADNKQREHRGESMAYGEPAFCKLSAELDELRTKL